MIQLSQVDEKLPNELPELSIIFIECPICHSAKYYPISLEIYQTTLENPSGITLLLISAGVICTHNFIIYIDIILKIRNRQKLDVVVDGN